MLYFFKHQEFLMLKKSFYVFIAVMFVCSFPVAAAKPLNLTQSKELFAGQYKRIYDICLTTEGDICFAGDRKVVIADKEGNEKRSIDLPEWPRRIDIDSEGNVYVICEKDNGLCFIKYDKEGKELTKFDITGPSRVSGFAAIGNELFISDGSKKAKGIYVYTMDGKQKTRIDDPDIQTCCSLLDISGGPDNRIYIANIGAYNILSCDTKGKKKSKWGKYKADFGGCCNPTNVSVCANTNIVVAEKELHRIKIFTKKGKLLATSEKGVLPKGCTDIPICGDKDMNVYVVDTQTISIKIFSASKK